MTAEAVHGAALDEILHGALVQLTLPHALDEVFQRFKGAALCTLANHSTNQSPTHIPHRPETEPDGISFHGKGIVRVVDIRG